jgi:hypothetical protein
MSICFIFIAEDMAVRGSAPSLQTSDRQVLFLWYEFLLSYKHMSQGMADSIEVEARRLSKGSEGPMLLPWWKYFLTRLFAETCILIDWQVTFPL